MSQALAGRNAIVTGASHGLGAAIARRFLDAGSAVAICGRDPHALAAQHEALHNDFPGSKIVSVPTDVANAAEVDVLFERALTELGSIDVLVNNAGIYGPMGTIETLDLNEWIHAIEVNLFGTVACCIRAVEQFKPRQAGKIINISGGGATSPMPGISAYAASKAAVVRFTESLALEVSPYGIDVNAVAPGALKTRLADELLAAGPEKVGADFHERMANLQASDQCTPLEVGAELCTYLASAASDGITGRLISAPWDPWPFTSSVRSALNASDVYTLRRIVPKDRGLDWGERV